MGFPDTSSQKEWRGLAFDGCVAFMKPLKASIAEETRPPLSELKRIPCCPPLPGSPCRAFTPAACTQRSAVCGVSSPEWGLKSIYHSEA
ncbi:hypothetical protein NDU88_005944 [Pleurodeles waltl]|uniref:Uncharacterized protein n=1 Tax=Pleurodeles waltl TaxID=8319 RepID=A0AAV7N5S9_PLEWA|nr:hypothetical protein NDU88_005944 [Pleurodeles waltl]